jgi:hypothetical protein
VSALYVWEGGLGIPGGIAGGFAAAWVMAHRRGISKSAFADSVAPGVVVAQAVGRLGNWFNQELFGRPTTLPWGLEIDPDNPDASRTRSPTTRRSCTSCSGTSGWPGSWSGPTAGGAWAAAGSSPCTWPCTPWAGSGSRGLRIDDAGVLLGLRLNQWVMGTVLVGALVFLVVRRRIGREDRVEPSRDPLELEPDRPRETA